MSIWLREPSRFGGLDRRIAWLILGLLGVILAASLITPATPVARASGDPAKRAEERADLILYERIIDRVRGGDNYYSAAAQELRAGNYPLRPFVAFRLPTLAWLHAALPPVAVAVLLWSLIGVTLIVWGIALRQSFARAPPLLIAVLLLASGMALFTQAELIVFHESWAAVLIALSLGLWALGRWPLAIAAALAAVLVRETVLPFLLVMGGLALIERRWREFGGWAVAAAVFAIVLWFHTQAVAAVTSAADPASPGWNSFGGWRFALTAMRLTTATRFAPEWLGSLLVVLSMIGWAAWRAPAALRVLGTLLAYVTLLSLFGRPDNFYWAMLTAPVLLAGLAFAVPGLADLAGAAAGRNSPPR